MLPRTYYRSYSGVRPQLVLFATCLISFVVALDITVITLALPSIQRDFGITLVESSWALNAYTLTFAALVIVGGRMGDIFGRRRFLIIGAILFATGLLMAFLSPDVETLVAARVVQALGGSMMMPGSLSVLTEAFQRRNMAMAIGAWGGIGAVGFIVGPLVGGGFTSLFEWRSIFLVSLTIILVAVAIIFVTVKESRDVTIDKRIDYLGVLLSAMTVLVVILAIAGGNVYGWTSMETLGLFALFVVAAALLLWSEFRVQYPIFDPRFFGNRAFCVGILVRFSAGFAFVPVILMSTMFLQNFLHKSPFEAGILFLPAGGAVVAATLFWGKIVEYHGPRIPMTIGMLMAGAAALLWLSFSGETTYGTLLISLLLASFGGAAAFVTTTTTVVHSLGVNKAGVASGIVYMTQNVSAALGVALVSSVFLNSLRVALAQRDPSADYLRVASFGPALGNAAQGEAFAAALSHAGLVVAVVLLFGAAVSLLLPKGLNFTHADADLEIRPPIGA